MCNCGKKRIALKQHAASVNKVNRALLQPALQKNPSVLFEYTGNTALTVTGGITRKNYRFNFNGDRQLIEYNDAAAMMAIPVLKRINN